mmetsp:Transcript_21503/g.51297  ORF Transcript_21503/g.51297 Transcript_21503/m.51297 type:complete len:432 (-) Transcript_21503:202-1497(-)
MRSLSKTSLFSRVPFSVSISQTKTFRRTKLIYVRPTAVVGTQRVKAGRMKQVENRVLELLRDARGRGKEGLSDEQRNELERAILQLESAGGLNDPTAQSTINGQWRLLYTSRPGTSSPIQRTFTGVDSFKVFQEVFLDDEVARINNCVEFGKEVGILRVEALANTDTRPIPGFIPRRGAGFPLLGKSSTEPPSAPNTRIDFQFDRAAFNFNRLPFKIPYPVPFRLVGDEGKGWIDVTYLSSDGQFRISRGNKGTTFVLVKEKTEQEQLLELVAEGDDDKVVEAIEQFKNPTKAPAKSPLVQGKWRLRWSKQASNANFLQKNLANSVRNFQIIYLDGEGNTRATNLVELGPLKIKTDAPCRAEGPVRTTVEITEVVFQLGPLEIPVKVGRPQDEEGKQSFGYVEWLYLDEDIRVTRGSKGSLFIHTREVSDA